MRRYMVVTALVILLVVAAVAMLLRGSRQRGVSNQARVLVVLCGAGLRPPMESIRAGFEAREGCRVKMNYAGSGTLLGKLNTGVKADLFIPGDIWYIHQAAARGRLVNHKVVGWLVPVIAVQKGNPRGITKLQDLSAEGLKVGLGQAEACAIGNVSRKLLRSANLADKVKPRYEALTVNLLANQIKLKALDTAIVWDATAAQYAHDIEIVPIENANFHAVPLAVGVLKQAEEKDLARRFAEYAAGELGARALRENSYQVPGHQLRVGCGASMRPPIDELARLFTVETGVKVLTNYGDSGTVLLQIQEAGQGDIYICHDPYAYVCENRKIAERWHTMAYLKPVLAVTKGNPKSVKGMSDLLRDDLKIGLPSRNFSTRGMILWTMLKKQGMAKAMEGRKFFEDRTHGLVNQLKLNTVDIAVLWDAPTNAMEEFEAIPFEEKFLVDAVTSATSGKTYRVKVVKVTVVQLNFSKEPILTAQFAKFCLSEIGRQILRKHSFTLPETQ